MAGGKASGKSGVGWLKIAMIGIGMLLGLALLGTVAGRLSRGSTHTRAEAYVAPEPPTTVARGLAGSRDDARRSAQTYLSLQGFSRQGLIDQLSSDVGDGYEVADAAAAVDSLNIDWNEQAVRSAQGYLSMMAFSCDGLIEQLTSSSGDRYTAEQARYAARKTGACQSS